MWSYNRSIVNQTHHSSVIIIITLTACHCSLFNVYQTVTACYCAKTAGCSHCRWEFCFRLQNMLFPFPSELFPFSFPFPISSRKLLPFPWESHGNPTGMGIPIPMHTSTALVLRSYLASVLPSLVWGSTCLNPASSSSSLPRTQPRSCDRCFDYITLKRTMIHVLTFMINISQHTKECKNTPTAHLFTLAPSDPPLMLLLCHYHYAHNRSKHLFLIRQSCPLCRCTLVVEPHAAWQMPAGGRRTVIHPAVHDSGLVSWLLHAFAETVEQWQYVPVIGSPLCSRWDPPFGRNTCACPWYGRRCSHFLQKNNNGSIKLY